MTFTPPRAASSSATRAVRRAFFSASDSLRGAAGLWARLGVFAGLRGPRSAQRPVCTVGGLDALAPAARLPALMCSLEFQRWIT